MSRGVEGVTRNKDRLLFVLTDQHLQLLRRAWIRWDASDFGAPAIDSKRPYGNGDVLGDVCQILGFPTNRTDEWGEQTYDDESLAFADRIHRETEAALQIVLATLERRTGAYGCDVYGINWEYLGSPLAEEEA